MTDTSSVAITNPPTAVPPVTANNSNNISNNDIHNNNNNNNNNNININNNSTPTPSAADGVSSLSLQPEEDEPYTIKCICSFEDDDGSTVYCERCDTWQHIVCYYEKQEVPEIHNCADCEPRFLDARGATERQRRLREQNSGGDRKSKRASAKSSKKKNSKDKDPEQAANALVTRERSASTSHLRDVPPPAKRSKTNHRFSSSVTSLNNNFSHQDRKRSSISIPHIPYYSSDFLHLYDNDQGNVNKETNLFQTITLTKDLMAWAQDPSTIPEDGTGRVARDSFTYLDRLDSSCWPGLTTGTKVDDSVEVLGRHPTWKVLTVDKDVRRDEIVGEVRGKVGYLRDYSLDPANRWQELRHPEPFVFFHPQLPIYIDSREEGTQLRYVRRSCQPNVTLKTFILNQSEYHFCFVANQDIPARSEITATWYLDPQLFGAHGFFKSEGSNDVIPEAAAISLSNVLSRFGGCACESSSCFLAKIDRRRRIPKSETSTRAVSRRSKIKSRSTIQSEGSRASVDASKKQQQQQQQQLHHHHQQQQQAQQQQEDEEDASERFSTNGSVRFQSRSRDFTPAAGSADTSSPQDPFSGELSAREKRKLAAVEKKFEQLEQQPKRRRKDRAPTAELRQRSSSPAKTAKATARPGRLDLSKSRRTSSSSVKTISPKSVEPTSRRVKTSPVLPRKKYVDFAIQVDLDEEDAAAAKAAAVRSFIYKKFVPPDIMRFQGLLKIYEADKKHFEEMRKRQEGATGADTAAARQLELKRDVTLQSLKTPTSSDAPDGTKNQDLNTLMSPPAALANSSLPSIAAHTIPLISKQSSDQQAAYLTSQPLSLPLVSIVETSPSGTGITATPGSSSAISPLAPALPTLVSARISGNAAPLPATTPATAPAPVKKKLTLGDYMSRRGTLSALPTPTTEKTPAQALESLSYGSTGVSELKPLDEEMNPEKSSAGSEDVVMGNTTEEKPPTAIAAGDSSSRQPVPISSNSGTEKQTAILTSASGVAASASASSEPLT
ncbi:hypothetical protein KEM54_006535 [Ascosphaera aggregata]|nr:hypothetical protein KEM54_006535 [Ascosphaera aggregata]